LAKLRQKDDIEETRLAYIKANAANIDVRAFLEKYNADTDFVTCGICGVEGSRYNTALLSIIFN